MKKVVVAAAALAAVIGLGARSQAPEMQRYLKIKRM
jgi:hypothetical protein